MSIRELKAECHTLRRKIWNFEDERKRIYSFLWIRRHIGTSLAQADLRRTLILKKLLEEKLAGKHCSMHKTDNRVIRRRKATGGSRNMKRYRLLAAETYGVRCVDCGKEDITLEELTLDHIVPVFKGGRTELENVRLLCVPCHNKKSHYEGKEADKIFWETFDVDKFLSDAEKAGQILTPPSN